MDRGMLQYVRNENGEILGWLPLIHIKGKESYNRGDVKFGSIVRTNNVEGEIDELINEDSESVKVANENDFLHTSIEIREKEVDREPVISIESRPPLIDIEEEESYNSGDMKFASIVGTNHLEVKCKDEYATTGMKKEFDEFINEDSESVEDANENEFLHTSIEIKEEEVDREIVISIESSVLGSCARTDSEKESSEIDKMKNTRGPKKSALNCVASAKRFKCDFCDKGYSRKDRLNAHLRSHLVTDNELFKCNVCHKSFARKDHFKCHLLTHTGTIPFKCDSCDKGYSRKDRLNAHLRTHLVTDNELFKCNVCDKSFARKDRFKCHLLTHTGTVPFKCDFCDKGYSRKDRLNAHLRTHLVTDNELFKCNVCDKSFARKDHFKCHSLTHTGIKPFKCDSCDKSFARRDHFKNHLLTHY